MSRRSSSSSSSSSSSPQLLPLGVRHTPPLVGIQLSASKLSPSSSSSSYTYSSSTSSSSSSMSSSSSSPSTYNASIMHRVVPNTLYDVTVKVDATPLDISSALSIPSCYISCNWITSRTPLLIPNTSLDNKKLDHFENNNRRRLCILSPAEIKAYKQLANSIRHSLLKIQFEQQQKDNQQQQQQDDENKLSNHSSSSITSSSLSEYISSTLENNQNQCGFATTGTHPDLLLKSLSSSPSSFSYTKHRRIVHKKIKSLYRITRSSCKIFEKGLYYNEIKINETNGEGGICIGIMGLESALNKMIGHNTSQIGYHNAGKIVHNNQWKNCLYEYNKNDIVSTIVQMNEDNMYVWFFKNGLLVHEEKGFKIDKYKDMYIGVSLYKIGSEITLKCCQNEWTYYENCLKQMKLSTVIIKGSFCQSSSIHNSDKEDMKCKQMNMKLKDTHTSSLHACASVLTPS